MATEIRQTVRERLDLYRSLLRRDPGVPELARLVALLEAELRAREAADPARRAPRRAR